MFLCDEENHVYLFLHLNRKRRLYFDIPSLRLPALLAHGERGLNVGRKIKDGDMDIRDSYAVTIVESVNIGEIIK